MYRYVRYYHNSRCRQTLIARAHAHAHAHAHTHARTYTRHVHRHRPRCCCCCCWYCDGTAAAAALYKVYMI